MYRKPWQELLWLYLTNSLSEEDRVHFEQYVAENDAHKQELEEWRLLASTVKAETHARNETLPALPASFFKKLDAQPQIQQSLNGSHSKQKSGMETKPMTVLHLQNQQTKSNHLNGQYLTLAAVMIAVIFFTGLIVAGVLRRSNNGTVIVPIEQEHTATPVPTLTPTITPTLVYIEPLLLTATENIIGQATQQASNVTATPTFTTDAAMVMPQYQASATPFPMMTQPPTILPVGSYTLTPTIVFRGSDTAPTALPPVSFTATPVPASGAISPLGSITPSVRQPIISAPARLISQIGLPGGDSGDDMAWSPDGNIIAVAAFNGVWLLNPNQLSGAISIIPNSSGEHGLISVAYAHDGAKLATLDWNKNLRVWDTETNLEIASYLSSDLWWELEFTPDNKAIVANNSNVIITLDDIAEQSFLKGDFTGAYILLNPDGKRIAAIEDNGVVRLLDIENGEILKSIETAASSVNNYVFSPDGRMLILGSVDGSVHLIDTEAGEEIYTTNFDGRIWGFGISPNGESLAVLVNGSSIHSVWLMSTKTHESSAVLIYDIPLNTVEFSPDGDQLAVNADDGQIMLLDISAR